MYEPNDPRNLTPEQKLFNIKVKLNKLDRILHGYIRDPSMPYDAVRVVHLMQAALKEIQDEVDRTV